VKLQAHLKATHTDAQPKLLKELAKHTIGLLIYYKNNYES